MKSKISIYFSLLFLMTATDLAFAKRRFFPRRSTESFSGARSHDEVQPLQTETIRQFPDVELPDPPGIRATERSKPRISAPEFEPILGENDQEEPAPVKFRGYLQETNNWCWAAVSQAIILSYTGKHIDQCVLASRHAIKPDRYCCSRPGSQTAVCQEGWEPAVVLANEGMGSVPSEKEGPTRKYLVEQLKKNRYVIAGHDVPGGEHVTLIYGMQGDKFTYFDPNLGIREATWGQLQHLYQPNSLTKLEGVLRNPIPPKTVPEPELVGPVDE